MTINLQIKNVLLVLKGVFQSTFLLVFVQTRGVRTATITADTPLMAFHSPPIITSRIHCTYTQTNMLVWFL